MTCYNPLAAYRGRKPNIKTGKIPIVFKREESNGQEIKLACGSCLGCRLSRSKQWAIRCVHEAALHKCNSFITLTYDDDHLPPDGSLNKKHFQDFMKRLRKEVKPQKIRYFHCGEYGAHLERPHYHACIFGWEFPDRYLFNTRAGKPLYISPRLEQIWGKGFCTVGELTFESAAYVARYIMKKITGDMAHEHYEKFDPITGEIHKLQAEYITMSRRPGIGRQWYDKYADDVYPDDFVVIQGQQNAPPKYYNGLYEIDNPEEMEAIKLKRLQRMKKFEHEYTPERLDVRRKVKEAQIKTLKRDYEDE